MKKAIACDFDGVLHSMKEGWTGDVPEGEPIKDAKWAMSKLVLAGFEVVVFTARKELQPVKDWLLKHNIPFSKVTNEKIPALIYIDDRGFRFENNWESIVKLFI